MRGKEIKPGDNIGLWTVIKKSKKGKYPYYTCKCRCGTIRDVNGYSLKSGGSMSCGCVRKENLIKAMNIRLKGSVENTNLFTLNTKLSKRNTSGIKGVSKKRDGKYQVYIGFKNSLIYLGTYDTLEEAAAARLEAEDKYYKPLLEKYNIK